MRLGLSLLLLAVTVVPLDAVDPRDAVRWLQATNSSANATNSSANATNSSANDTNTVPINATESPPNVTTPTDSNNDTDSSECSIVVTPDDVVNFESDRVARGESDWRPNAFVHPPVCGSGWTNESEARLPVALDRLSLEWHHVEDYGTLCTCREVNVTESCTDPSTTASGHVGDAAFVSAAQFLFGGKSYDYTCVNQFPTCLDPDYKQRRAFYYRRGLLESSKSVSQYRQNVTSQSLTLRRNTQEQVCFTYTEDAVDPDDSDIGDGSGRLCWTLEFNDEVPDTDTTVDENAEDVQSEIAATVGQPCQIDYNGVACLSCFWVSTAVIAAKDSKNTNDPLSFTCMRANCTNVYDDAVLDTCPGLAYDATTNVIDTSDATKLGPGDASFVGPFRFLANFETPLDWKSCNATSTSGSSRVVATARFVVALVAAGVAMQWTLGFF